MAESSANELVVAVERLGAAAVVHIRGSAGMNEADALEGQLLQLVEQAVPLIVIDMTGLEFICSAGVGALISAHVKSRDRRGQVRLAGPQDRVLKLLETTRLTTVLSIFPDVAGALGA